MSDDEDRTLVSPRRSPLAKLKYALHIGLGFLPDCIVESFVRPSRIVFFLGKRYTFCGGIFFLIPGGYYSSCRIRRSCTNDGSTMTDGQSAKGKIQGRSVRKISGEFS